MRHKHWVGLGVLALAWLPGAALHAQTRHSDLKTRWAAAVSPENALPEYPRPQMVREQWTNLNGKWDYAITDEEDATEPRDYDGTILVPYPLESQLSGVRRFISQHSLLWYHRTFHAAALAAGEHMLLHFGAVNWRTTVEVNGHVVGKHEGGYEPFTIDITNALRPDADTQSVIVEVWDPTHTGEMPRGKQGTQYTPVSGIWQTVWLEPVPAASIESLELIPDIDAGILKVIVHAEGTQTHDVATVTAEDGSKVVGTASGAPGDTIDVHIPHAHLWSPDDPFLYNLQIKLKSGDHVASYAGMRKISLCQEGGFTRTCLNNHFLFELGLLDQGWWPDGLYTPPTDSAMIYDLSEIKALGFNMLRKHIKVEPDRWYYYADKLGVLVWQDMVSGENRSMESRAIFASEGQRMMAALRTHPSIIMWIVFNEGWGQHDTKWYASWAKAFDPTRLLNVCTGCDAEGTGDLYDDHDYFSDTLRLPKIIPGKATVIGEFGGVAVDVPGHTWATTQNGGEGRATSVADFDQKYISLNNQIKAMKAQGLSASVFTQITDVENETNGIITYDRGVVKLSPEDVALNKSIIGN